MVVLCEEVADSSLTVVTFMQTIRLLSVVFIVPFLAIHGLADSPGQSAAMISAAEAVPTSLYSLTALGTFIIAATISALAASRLNMPTPYLLGPIIAIAGLTLAGLKPPPVPGSIVMAAQLFVGAYLGVTIKPANLSNWKQLLPYALANGVAIVLFSLAIGYVLNYWHQIDLITAFLSTAPGGMSEMGITAIAVHADLSVITAYQLFRLLFILLIIPPLFRRWLGQNPKQN